ncbi:MAG: hypothetical protein AB8G99_01130 [Planctomycetaceae bacterium]
MFRRTTIGTLTALLLLTSTVVQADFRAKEKRGTLQITGTGPGTVLFITEDYGQVVVVSAFGSDIVDQELTQIQSFDASEITGVSVKLGTHSVAMMLMDGQDVQVKGGGAAEFILVSGEVGNLDISSGGGNDYVFVADVEVLGDAEVNTGGGHDICTVAFATFFGAVDIALGGGDDELFVPFASLSHSTDICFNGGGGDDYADIGWTDIDLTEFLKKFEDEVVEDGIEI